MLYFKLGVVSSKEEEDAVVAAIEARALPRSVMKSVAEFSVNIDELDEKGFAAVRDAWILTDNPDLVVFTGKQEGEEPTTRGGPRVFAAIELDPRGRVGALVKLSWDYAGAPDEWANNLTDAIDRLRNGTRMQ